MKSNTHILFFLHGLIIGLVDAFPFQVPGPLNPFVTKLYRIKNCDEATTSLIIKQTSYINSIECIGVRYFYEPSTYAPGVVECRHITEGGVLGLAITQTPNSPFFRVILDTEKAKKTKSSLSAVILHEFGHTIGLEHNEIEPTSVMYPGIENDKPKLFTFYDLKKIQEIFPICINREYPLPPFPGHFIPPPQSLWG